MEIIIIIILCFALPFTECSDVFVLVGDSVQLHTQEPLPEFRTLFWKFNKTENILEYSKKYKDITPSSRLKDRVEFNNETYSLTLKNLQKTDSGLWEAIAAGEKDTVVAVYTLSVLDPVEAPVLTSSPEQSNSDPCNITVSCSGHDSSISSVCYNKTCPETNKTWNKTIVLSLFTNGSFIICNHSNPVSWKKAVLEMSQVCVDKGSDNKQKKGTGTSWPFLAVFGLLGLLGFVACAVYVSRAMKKKSTGAPQCENTLYAEVQPNGENIPLEHPSTLYSVVGAKAQTSGTRERSQTTPSPEKQQTDPTTPTNTYESVPDMIQWRLKNDTCNITVSCKSQNLFINSSCYNETCERPYEISHEGITFSLFMRGSSIICNHSNPVS
ncbi:SLAM family member 5-like [Hoplias malabaricus]|uniref:SLAM family member 5-like n=1 Tax=Hoplias malabaricus TaxID=27720 RepID=UPI003462A9B7